jgi:hypothetical protein
MTTITITEDLDVNKLQTLILSTVDPIERNMLLKIKKEIIKKGTNKVDYRFDSSIRLSTKSPSVMHISKKARSFLLSENFVDLDMSSSNLRVIDSLLLKENMTEYHESFNKLITSKQSLHIKSGLTEKEFKSSLNAFLFGNLTPDFLDRDFVIVFRRLREELCNKYKSLIKVKKESSNYYGTGLSHIYFYYEAEIMKCAIDYFNSKDIKYSTLVYDGFHIPKGQDIDLDALSDYIHESINFQTIWKYKEWEPVNLQEFSFPPEKEHSDTSENINDVIFDKFVEWAKDNNLVRLRDTTQVLKKKTEYHAEIMYYNYEETLNGFIEENESLFDGAGIKSKRDNLREFLKCEQPKRDFPVVKRNWKYFGYSNGLYDITTDTFITEDYPEGVLCRNYFDCSFKNTTKIPNEILKVFHDQKWNDTTIDIYLACIGRLYYPINAIDNWGIITCNVGVSNTGKSTILESVVNSLDRAAVKTVGSDDTRFTLHGANNQELLYMGEAEQIHKGIKGDTLKKIARGELVSIEGKGKDTKSEVWSTPLALCSNFNISYPDNSGGIQNRIINFSHNYIIDADPKLKETINSMSPSLVPLYVKKYLKIANTCSRLVLNEQIEAWNDEIYEQADLFLSWLNTPREELYYQIVYSLGKSIKLTELQQAWDRYYKFAQNKHGETPKLNINDYAKLQSLGIFYETKALCKSCQCLHKKNCCDKYSRTNKTTKRVFMNAEIIAGGLNRRQEEAQDPE